MNKDYTHVTLVVDRSGSMCSMDKEATVGINQLIDDQKKVAGKCTFTLVQFDSTIDFIYLNKDIKEITEKYILIPRHSTSLYDAIGQAIEQTGKYLSKLPEAERPALVIFAIYTDGHENSSTIYSKSKIKEMITHQQTKYNWQFSFLAANQDAFLTGGDLGLDSEGTANYNNCLNAYVATSGKLTRMRAAVQNNLQVDNSYTEAEVDSMME